MSRFFQFVEIRTKITSLFAFLMALAWLFAVGGPIRWLPTLVFFLSMFLFDLTTTAINNFVDTRTNGQSLPFRRATALALLLALFAVSAALGLWLVALTDLTMLLFGGACFLCGVFYTWGPLPISRLPLGELFSGVFYGLAIPFLVLYLNMPEETFLTLALSGWDLSVTLRLGPLVQVLLLAVAPGCATANIMLANNLCDLERDIAVKRHTLPYYLGVGRSLGLFRLLCYLPFGAAAVLVASRALPPIYLLLFLALVPMRKNIAAFQAVQDKETTFPCSIRNYLALMSLDVLLLFLCHWF